MSACPAEDVICTAQQAEVRNVGREGRKRTGTGAAANFEHEEGCLVRAYTQTEAVSQATAHRNRGVVTGYHNIAAQLTDDGGRTGTNPHEANSVERGAAAATLPEGRGIAATSTRRR